MRSNAPRGRDAWRGIIAEFEQSGLAHAESCEARGLKLWTFRAWLYRVREEQGRRKVRRSKLVELVAVPQRTDADGGCVVRVGSAEVRFSACPGVEYLSALLRAVEER